ncbi:hypothetical protein CBI38_36125 (plasmid) [Rhodococcus oxybenzonivorans]|uniref:Uncharacterized protein n=1 Tax=Rhodococcus oxybenzonivorans TaxID=1990687 RepID=A0A2S2C7L6_9NOCA|nr:hypothetical protein CBI38_36125 [Rhodococcus oxybenzonivorans]
MDAGSDADRMCIALQLHREVGTGRLTLDEYSKPGRCALSETLRPTKVLPQCVVPPNRRPSRISMSCRRCALYWHCFWPPT